MSTSFVPFILIFFSFYSTLAENQFFRVFPEDFSALIETNVTIPCVIAPPHGDVQWTKDGLALGYERDLPAFPRWSIVGDESRGEWNFFIQSLKPDDEGLFACEVSPFENSPALKRVAHLRTFAQPKQIQIFDQNSNQHIEEISMRFDEVQHQIHCRVDGARPAAHIRWFNQTDYEFPATSRTVLNGQYFSTISTLTLEPWTDATTKNFTCSAFHPTVNELKSSVEIHLTSPPNDLQILTSSTEDYFLNGTKVTLICRVRGGNPLGKIFWFRNGNRLTSDINSIEIDDKIESNLTFIVSSIDNQQKYSCQVENEYLVQSGEKLEKTFVLNVAFGPSSVHIVNKDSDVTTTITQGDPFVFSCRNSPSNPPASITWRLNGEIVQVDEKSPNEFPIGLKQTWKNSHLKILSCEAKNPLTNFSIVDSTRLNVIYDATSIEIHGLIRDRMLNVGERVTAECFLNDGNPQGEIQWFKGVTNRFVVPSINQTRVEFVVTTDDHLVPLICQGRVAQFPLHIITFYLNVTFPPKEIELNPKNLLTNLSLDDPTGKEIECRASPSNPRVYFKVFRRTKFADEIDDLQIVFHDERSIRFLLPPVDLSLHESQLICQAMFDIDPSTVTNEVKSDLFVNHRPKFSSSFNRTISIEENQSMNFSLIATAFPLSINFSCEKFFVVENEIILTNVQRNQSGPFVCFATNSLGTTSIELILNVFYSANVIELQGYSLSNALMPGSSARLVCLIDGNPIDLTRIRWTKSNQQINEWQTDGTVAIKSQIHRDDAGEYQCEVSNEFGQSQRSTSIFVQYPPEIDRSEIFRNKIAVDADRNLHAELRCRISAIPTPNVIWLKDNQSLIETSKYQTMLIDGNSSSNDNRFDRFYEAILHIINVTKSDHGLYQCQAENPLGFDRNDIILTGLTVPDRPTDFNVINRTFSTIFFIWTKNFDGGNVQRYQIRYRLVSSSVYNYDDVPLGSSSYELRNLRSSSNYSVCLRANNSYYVSEWTDEMIVSTLPYNHSSSLFLFVLPYLDRYSWAGTVSLVIIALTIVLINFILILCFVCQRRRQRQRQHSTQIENSSSIGTNETENPPVDLFQSIASNYDLERRYLPKMNLYRTDEEDSYRPFVPPKDFHRFFLDDLGLTKNTKSKSNFQPSPYDNIRTFRVYPDDEHPYIQAELV